MFFDDGLTDGLFLATLVVAAIYTVADRSAGQSAWAGHLVFGPLPFVFAAWTLCPLWLLVSVAWWFSILERFFTGRRVR